mmetsp:Transcript_41571/g.69143  ORF Transcript_41571/g.69143 Transcript_41571/m.69143 type:complete len:821 (-) Transcript_41571:191-2653(-)|eukprot:CAMPEP_0119313774 /NCGR_PEP_ID=MMETSP1333-20130426/30351_1 /TAXON_ID=418940 /ORGANISM="Scyphosphaera apsteinii, Strain RCC1455" /LENGTH=820 /DNA_ID=CAMNT_0007318709 /DNA_START=136 /DNA_END=2598 /DNA_ORIENTATION=-
MSEANDASRHRAKVYCLNENGQWDDRGTGHAAVQYSPAEEAAFVVVLSEDDGSSALLNARVHMEDIYQRQQETIVSWNEPETGVDYALSFQDSEGCTELWEQICSLQGRSPDEQPRDAESSSAAQQGGGANDALPQLPAAELRNVSTIAELLADAPIFKRAKLIEALLQQNYIPQLVDLFGVVEDLENKEDLHHMFNIFKGLVMLNDSGIYDIILREDLVMGVVGALEYDPDLTSHKVRHRAFLTETVRFKQVVPITDETILKKIHQNYRLGFLKDVVLPRALDDNAFAALNQIAFFNNMQIISTLSSDPIFLQALSEKIADTSQSADSLLEALRLLQELCTIAKQLQLYNRTAFYRKFCEHSCFAPLAACLLRPEPQLRLSGLEVLLASVQHEPQLLRQFVLQQRPECQLLHAIVGVLVCADGNGEKPQAAEVLRCLLDPEGMEGREQDELLNLFYEDFVHRMAHPVVGKVSAGTGPMNGVSDKESLDAVDEERRGPADVLSSRQHVCELLCFCVQKHSYRIKYFILRNNVLQKVLRFATQRDKCLVLAAMRFFRTCIGLKDEFYNRYIIKNRCFDPVVSQLRANCTRDNLVHSAILELFDFVRRENIKALIGHLAEAYQEQLASMRHVDIFKGLLLRHEQNDEIKGSRGPNGGPTGTNCATNPAVGRRAFPDEDDDEAYFNESDDDDDEPALSLADDDDRPFTPRQPAVLNDDTEPRFGGEEKENRRDRYALQSAMQSFTRAGRGSPPPASGRGSPPPASGRGSPPPDGLSHTIPNTAPVQSALTSLVSDYDVAEERDVSDDSRKRRRVAAPDGTSLD